jgi:hypothetical protein
MGLGSRQSVRRRTDSTRNNRSAEAVWTRTWNTFGMCVYMQSHALRHRLSSFSSSSSASSSSSFFTFATSTERLLGDHTAGASSLTSVDHHSMDSRRLAVQNGATGPNLDEFSYTTDIFPQFWQIEKS